MEAQNSITLSDITNLLDQGALLRYQGCWHLVWGPFEASSKLINHEISIFCPTFYDSKEDSYLRGTRSQQISSELLSDLLESFLQSKTSEIPGSALSELAWQEPVLADYRAFFEDVQSKIRSQEIRKAVPVVFAKATKKVSTVDRAVMLQQLLKAPASLYVYGYWDSEGGLLGATPEVLFTAQNKKIQTMALAGTSVKSSAFNPKSLLEDAKEREEHELVVQDITEVLGRYGAVQKSETHLLELPTLWHLKTDLSMIANETISYIDLVKKMHPTPALGVYPRQAGYQWMQRYADQKERGRFGAPFMFVFPDKNEAICLVAIRNLQWNKDQIFLGAGAGVVAASQLEREWQELSQKRESVKKILGVK